jgi:TolB-like protein/Tfp pilus assembly protein PilF
MSQGERRLAAIMFTDIVGYTALTQSNEGQAMEVLERHNKLLRPFFPRFHGREIKTMGDAFLVEFENALDAAKCAVEIQSYLHDYNVSSKENWKIKLRIGIHLGDVIRKEGDVFGDAVNIASRIQPIAAPEGVTVSRHVYDQIHNKLDLPMIPLGEKSLKNVSEPIEIYAVQMPWERLNPVAKDSLEARRVAILPFVNMSPDPQDEFFADGLTEELIGRISQVRELEVIARTSVMSYKKKDKKAGEIGRELNVGSLVEGSVRRSGNKVRVTAQLIDTNRESHLWSSNYDRDLQDIFEVQSDISEKVAEALRVQLLPAERMAIEKKPTSNKEAHLLYLKGRYHWNERTPKSSELAVQYFEKAIKEDPSYAPAYVGLADALTILSDQGVKKPYETGLRIKDLAEKALELDPTLAEAHASLANVLAYVFWDWPRSELEFKRCIDLNPAYPTGRQWYGKYLSFLGRYDDAVEQHHRALLLDPYSLIININYAEGLAEAGRYSEAVEQSKKTVALDPNFLIGHFEFGIIYLGGLEFEKAENEFKKALEIVPDFPAALGHLAYGYSISRRRDEGELVLSRIREIASRSYVPPATIALAEFGLGQTEEAFKHFDEALEERSPWLLYFKAFPAYQDLKSDVRFQRILSRMGLE